MASKTTHRVTTHTAAKKRAAATHPRTAHRRTASPLPETPSPTPAPVTLGGAASSSGSSKGLRVRMFRVGFGDFFRVRVPTASGDKYILIDCGVHHKAAGDIKVAVAQMAQDCQSHLG
jgi:hypothetical protein